MALLEFSFKISISRMRRSHVEKIPIGAYLRSSLEKLRENLNLGGKGGPIQQQFQNSFFFFAKTFS